MCARSAGTTSASPRDPRLDALLDAEGASRSAPRCSRRHAQFRTRAATPRGSPSAGADRESDALVVMQGSSRRSRGMRRLRVRFHGRSMDRWSESARARRAGRHRAEAAVRLLTASGGARMQEGLLSLVQMAKTTAASPTSERRLPFISCLTDRRCGVWPGRDDRRHGDRRTQGADRFAGPRVIEQTVGRSCPKAFQRAEFLLEKGAIDMIVDRRAARQLHGILSSCRAARRQRADAAFRRGAHSTSLRHAQPARQGAELPNASASRAGRNPRRDPFLSGEIRQGSCRSVMRACSRRARAAIAATLTIRDVDQTFDELKQSRQGCRGSARKEARPIVRTGDCRGAGFLARLIVGELRQGALEGVMRRRSRRRPSCLRRSCGARRASPAVSRRSPRPRSTGGATALERFSIRLMQPVLPMLAQPARTSKRRWLRSAPRSSNGSSTARAAGA